MKPFPQMRLSNVLLAVVVTALFVELYILNRREAQLGAEIALYRNPWTEGILEALDQPLALRYSDGATLEALLKDIKGSTTGSPKLKFGIPIYVDPIGLEEAGKWMQSRFKKPPSAGTFTLGEHLRAALDPLGLAYQVKDGFLMVTSKESLDKEIGLPIEVEYRDVLR